MIRAVQTIPTFFSTLLLACLRLVFPLQTGFEQGKRLFHRRASYQRVDREMETRGLQAACFFILGRYVYQLIVNGTVVDKKKMVLAK